MYKKTILLAALIAAFTPISASAIGFSSNWGLGYGQATQEFGDRNFSPQSIAGHADLQLNLWKFILGVSYLTVSNYNFGDERSYVGMGAFHAGLNLSNSVQLIGGIGAGQWRRRRSDEPTVPRDYDYKSVGGGYMAGIRIFLINTKNFSLGFSGTYYHMKGPKYDSIEDGVKTEVLDPSKGTGSIAALVFRISLDDLQKLRTK
jgi:hypothetical protein